MFSELVPLVRASEKVVLTLSMQGDTMSVVVVPVVKNPADGALTTPLALAASPAELDAGFADAVSTVTDARQSLAEQAEATKSILDAAKSTQSAKATKALVKASPTSTSSAADADDEDGEDGEGGATPGSVAKAEPAQAAEPAGTNLADLL
jgi:PRTRC genetic system protein E